MTPTLPPITLDSMARKVGVQKGYLYKRGPSWLVQFTEYVAVAGGSEPIPRCERVGPCVGPERLTKQEARAIDMADMSAIPTLVQVGTEAARAINWGEVLGAKVEAANG